MTDKIEFPGGWAKLRDPRDVTERNRRPLDELQGKIGGSNVGQLLLQWEEENGRPPTDEEANKILRPLLGDDGFGLLKDSDYLLIAALVEEWSFSDLPINIEGVKDLPGRAYDALRDACQPLLTKVLGHETEDDILDPGSPTPPGSV